MDHVVTQIGLAVDRIQAVEALRQTTLDYRALFENAHDAILIFAPEDEEVLEKRRRIRLQWAQRGIAVLVTLPFAIWIALDGTGTYFPRYAWLLPLAGAYYLGLRIGGVVVRGWIKAREQRLELPHAPLDD